MSTAQITIPLDLPDVRVLQTQLTAQGEFIITVESTLSSARCHRCGRVIRKSHGHDDWVIVQHLPILGRPVYLRYRPSEAVPVRRPQGVCPRAISSRYRKFASEWADST